MVMTTEQDEAMGMQGLLLYHHIKHGSFAAQTTYIY
jgi:hypothetical protein